MIRWEYLAQGRETRGSLYNKDSIDFPDKLADAIFNPNLLIFWVQQVGEDLGRCRNFSPNHGFKGLTRSGEIVSSYISVIF